MDRETGVRYTWIIALGFCIIFVMIALIDTIRFPGRYQENILGMSLGISGILLFCLLAGWGTDYDTRD